MAVQRLRNLDELLNAAKTQKKMAVIFWVTWSGPSKFMRIKFDGMCLKYPDIYFAAVDIDAAESAAAHFKVEAEPEFRFFKDGNELADQRVIGAAESLVEARLKAL